MPRHAIHIWLKSFLGFHSFSHLSLDLTIIYKYFHIIFKIQNSPKIINVSFPISEIISPNCAVIVIGVDRVHVCNIQKQPVQCPKTHKYGSIFLRTQTFKQLLIIINNHSKWIDVGIKDFLIINSLPFLLNNFE